jgi:hypothetical protein
LREKALDSLTHLVTFRVEGAHFFLERFDDSKLFAELSIEFFCLLLCGGARLALIFDKCDSPGDSLFKG